jgi:hypothetical protein
LQAYSDFDIILGSRIRGPGIVDSYKLLSHNGFYPFSKSITEFIALDGQRGRKSFRGAIRQEKRKFLAVIDRIAKDNHVPGKVATHLR